MDQSGRLFEKIDTILAEAGEMRTEQALARQLLGSIQAHLDKLNGRVGTNEGRLTTLETLRAEGRGAWKLILLAASLPVSAVAAAWLWVAQNSQK